LGGRWVLGARQGRPRGSKSTTRSLRRRLDIWPEGPGRGHHNGIVVVAIGALWGLQSPSVGCWVLGGRWVLDVGRWVLGVGCWVRGRVAPGVRRLKGRWVALPPPVSRRPGWYTSPDPAAAPHLAAAAPRGEGTRATSRRLPPKHPAGSQHPPYRKIPRSGRKIFGRWVFDIGRWVSTDLGVGCPPRILGVGWHGPPVGCWVLGVGCLWRRRWVVLEDPEGRQRGGSTSAAA
jgi:hypothetical protein